jgi:hypothetical protein
MSTELVGKREQREGLQPPLPTVMPMLDTPCVVKLSSGERAKALPVSLATPKTKRGPPELHCLRLNGWGFVCAVRGCTPPGKK